mmetsp:Transcript_117179/g.251952  ORF Transcript_117179/g.251952 Transcript_117179/m.251952 type:complete len:273 (-) Transcript_117179:73-891(-)|eukprot:CAMPEP_0116914006 /NCGR_PEP_ID=MMETSP0467-20121206/17051_1 /TAXON_ID=283647 /ORGANISM="Mesodinium pulex, Strain SPMC105" /LENGTH=272 /DNA_ID=CAMNT_0004590347 /DNA_START=188 /DNA_END=1006 /DNA_ORIENTATION=-
MQLGDLNVTEQDFLDACTLQTQGGNRDMSIFDQILSVDNFIAFKKLMVKKNKELYLEAYKILESEGQLKKESNEKEKRKKTEKLEMNQTNLNEKNAESQQSKSESDTGKTGNQEEKLTPAKSSENKKIEETLKKEMNAEKDKKIIKIYEKKLETDKDITPQELESIKKDLGPLKPLRELQPLGAISNSKKSQVDEIMSLIKNKKLEVQNDEAKKKDEEQQKERDIKKRESHFNYLRDQIKNKTNDKINSEFSEYVKQNGNVMDNIPQDLKKV